MTGERDEIRGAIRQLLQSERGQAALDGLIVWLDLLVGLDAVNLAALELIQRRALAGHFGSARDLLLEATA